MNKDIPMNIKMNNPCFPDIAKLASGKPADESQIHIILDYIDQRLDCADFRMICILRCLYDFADLISEPTRQRMKQTVLGFKYWLDEPGADSMCYWSENHQAIFAVCEYLAGQLYPEETFLNDQTLGRFHLAKARERLEHWLEARFRFGFVEWHSNTYYEEDIAPLSLFIDCCQDELLVAKARTILDLFFLDMALHHYRSYLAATSGRCYEEQKKYPHKQDVADIMQKAFGFRRAYTYDYTRTGTDFLLNRSYRLPDWILKIAQDEHLGEVKVSMGLDLEEIDHYFPYRHDIYGRAMYLWSMEAFSNPEAAETALKLYKDWNLSENDFLKNLDALDIPVISRSGLLPLAVRVLNPVTSGIAIQRVNSYSYKTPDYLLSSAQKYHPGSFGDQQHIWQATFGRGQSVFTTHPGAAFFEDNARNFSPSFWVGNGVLPDCRQDKNVLLCVYDLSVRKGYMEKERLLYTHAWFPQERIRVNPRCVLAKDGDSYIALFSLEALTETLEQKGTITAWACVCGSPSEYFSFENFQRLCAEAELSREGQKFSFSWGGSRYQLNYKKDFLVNGELRETEYPRLQSKYGTVPRDPRQILTLEWPERIRDLRQAYLPEADPYTRIVALAKDVVSKIKPQMKWMWGEALFGYALSELDRYRATDEFTPFLYRYCQYWLENTPAIDYADRIAPALITYAVSKRTGSRRFDSLTQAALNYVLHAPRLLDDAVNHLGNSPESRWYPDSIWVDSLMMFSVFPSLYASEQNDPELLAFAARQPKQYARYLQDSSGLWVHSYWTKAARPHPADRSFWGRGNGWALSALPMILENIGPNHAEAPEIIRLYRSTLEALLPYQNADGSFNTIINKRSYREMSATALIASGIFHGIRLGIADASHLTAGERALNAVSEAIIETPDGLALSEISAPTIPLHLFPTLCYRLTPRGKNWSYGLAAALFAAIQYRRLMDEEMQ